MSVDTRIKSETMKVVAWLAEHNYHAIVDYTNSIRLPYEEIDYAIEDYGRRLVMPPDAAFEELDVIEVENADPREWSVRCPLWTLEEGRSDLTLEMSMIEAPDGKLRVEIDNILVL